nr:phospholipid carrier-dependent glycosyltransferase [Ornithinicoccus halotolerans]
MTRAEPEAQLRRRLLGPEPGPRHRLWGWLGPLLVTAVAAVLRFFRLEHPHQLVFDETYYVKQAWSLVLHGHEREVRGGLEEPDALFTAGTPDVWGTAADMVVHPPVGKWMIAVGELVAGVDTGLGWRLASAVVGTLSVLLVGRAAWHLFHHATLATAASLLLAVDGHHFAHSRIGLLDVFVMFWVLCAFLALLLDRRQARSRLAERCAGLDPGAAVLRWGPGLGLRWWRVAAGLCLGLALGTKWSAGFFLAAFGLMTVLWDVGARRAAGVRRWLPAGLLRDGVPAFLAMVPVALLTYLVSWAGWFRADDSYKRHWAASHPATGWEQLVPDALRSLGSYHAEIMRFHVGLQNEHAWSANPWSWIVQGRPTLFFAEWPSRGEDGCQAAECVRYIASLGNLVLWWGAVAGLLVVAFWWLLGRDWRAGAVLSGVAAGWLPWFLYQSRTIYSFYAVAFVPWLALVLTFCLGLLLGGTAASERRRRWGTAAVLGVLALAVLWFAWYYPVHTAELLTREQWLARMRFDFWT